MDGLIVTVPLKITDAGVQQHVKGPIDAARNDRTRNIKKVVLDFTPEGKDAATEEFGPCYGLARYLKTLAANGIETIAFVHGKIGGHTVPPAIACDHLGMSAGAVLTPVSPPARRSPRSNWMPTWTPRMLERAGPVLRLIDKNVRLVKADYKGSKVYADLSRIERKDPACAEVHAGDLTPVQVPANGQFDVHGRTSWGSATSRRKSGRRSRSVQPVPRLRDRRPAAWQGHEAGANPARRDDRRFSAGEGPPAGRDGQGPRGERDSSS